MHIKILFFGFVSVIVFLLVNKFSFVFKMVDTPSKKKFHQKVVPYTGGLAIFICFLIYQKFFDSEYKILSIILSYSIFLILLGLIDDKYGLNVGSRLMFQIFIGYLVFEAGLKITSVGVFPYLNEIKTGEFSVIFTIFMFIFFFNSSNYIDGIDGLAGTLFIISVLSPVLFFNNIIVDRNIINFVCIICLIIIIFLFFNFSVLKLPKMFLGNSGSLLLGYFLGCYLIFLTTKYNELPKSLIFFCTPIMFFEFVATNLSRLLRKKHIFKGGKDHIHYLLYRKYGQSICLLILNISNLVMAFLFCKISMYSELYSIILFILFFTIFFYLRENLIKKKY